MIMLRTMKMTLTLKQKKESENQHDKARDGRECDHIKAVLHQGESMNVRFSTNVKSNQFVGTKYEQQ